VQTTRIDSGAEQRDALRRIVACRLRKIEDIVQHRANIEVELVRLGRITIRKLEIGGKLPASEAGLKKALAA
jgi:hypothetical protein